MKWPKSLMLIRHDTSKYNILRVKKAEDILYQKFLESWNKDWQSSKTIKLAKEVMAKFSLGVGDANTLLADPEGRQAYETGVALSKEYPTPDVVFVSPYKRTKLTLDHLIRGWPELADVKKVEEERIREQEHGLALLYNDWRVFFTLNPDQKRLYDMEGPYRYRYPQGENVPDVRIRNWSWGTTLIREFAGKRVMSISHHLNILALRANFERLGEEEFIRLDNEEKPINCGVTEYRFDPRVGSKGKLMLEYYNRQYYK